MTGRIASIAFLALMLAACGESSGSNEAAPAAAAPVLTQVRVAFEAPATGACVSSSPEFDPGQKAYIEHLSERMDIPVMLCPFASRTEAAQALADGQIELALLDAASIAAVKDVVRPIMTQRIPADLGRVEVVLAVMDASPIQSAADARQRPMIIPGENSTVLAGVQATLEQIGFAKTDQLIAPSRREALAALLGGKGEVMAMQSAQWTRLCRGETRGETPCDGLREVWRGRQPAEEAWSARRDLPLESWARLLGIHIALVQENPLAAGWIAPAMTEIEPIEATGLEKPL
ncbi:MAG: phosphate/phosphite/phosphonate ABC transporter substrate-binding protein [Alphaproteobacteria bacterium]|nr:phosphate/phosphite/phosphonate ABC transporter substrate-binding protein [Alphaproteobacteria bacterium]